MRQHTERELRVWLAWMTMQWDNPDRSDYYLMQVACEVRRVLSNNPRGIKVADFRLQFGQPAAGRPASRQQAAEWSKARWFAAVGLGDNAGSSVGGGGNGN